MASKVKDALKSTAIYRILRTTRPDLFFKLHPDAYADLVPVEKQKVIRRMNRAHILYGISYEDFWRCHCERKEWSEIEECLPYRKQKEFWMQVNAPSARAILGDKSKAYQHFKEFYHRDVLLVKGGEQDVSELSAFASCHPRFLVKPLNQRWGKGVQIVDVSAGSDSVKSLLQSYPDGFLAEELIVQDPALGQFHPQSVNTLRINSFLGPDGPEVKWPCLRMGRGSNIVDNAGAGGIFGAIDVASGRIIGVSDESNHFFEKHPDTGLQLVGFVMPRWEEACALVKELAPRIPDAHFVGWDLALTPDGWVMVEGNYCPLLIWQFASGIGIRREFEEMKREYGTIRNQ